MSDRETRRQFSQLGNSADSGGRLGSGMARLRALSARLFAFGTRFRSPRVRMVVFLTIVLAGLVVVIKEIQKVKGSTVNSWTENHVGDCAVVLTGGPNRIREGFDLLARKSVQKLIISGVNPKAELREIFPNWTYYGDLKEQDVILERRSRTTFGNAQQTLPIIEALRCREVILITSSVHMYRAYSTFRAEFPSSVALTARAVASKPLVPSRAEVFEEVIKSLFYELWAY